MFIEQTNPKAKFFVLDTENKFRSAMRGFGTDAPGNIVYFKCDTMNDVTAVTAEVMRKHQPGDWLAVESLSRVWERAQDLAYNATAGVSKIEYLERRPKSGKGSGPIPTPDDFWKIAKGAHDGAFFDLLTQSEDLNVVMTTTIAKPPKEGFIKENADRKNIRIELGTDANLEGAPRIPYYVETLIMLSLKDGAVSARVFRDNMSTCENPRQEFDIPDRKSFGVTFFATCRS